MSFTVKDNASANPCASYKALVIKLPPGHALATSGMARLGSKNTNRKQWSQWDERNMVVQDPEGAAALLRKAKQDCVNNEKARELEAAGFVVLRPPPGGTAPPGNVPGMAM